MPPGKTFLTLALLIFSSPFSVWIALAKRLPELNRMTWTRLRVAAGATSATSSSTAPSEASSNWCAETLQTTERARNAKSMMHTIAALDFVMSMVTERQCVPDGIIPCSRAEQFTLTPIWPPRSGESELISVDCPRTSAGSSPGMTSMKVHREFILVLKTWSQLGWR